jgi:hypothetical protein
MKAQRCAIEEHVVAEPHNRLLATRRLSAVDVIDRQSVTVNLAESPLAWLARRGLVSAAQFEASERLRHDFMMAGQAPRVTMRWYPAPVSGGGGRGDPTTTQMSAKQRFEAAMTAVGPGLSDVVWRVICLGEGL